MQITKVFDVQVSLLLIKNETFSFTIVQPVPSGNMDIYFGSINRLTYYFFALNLSNYALWTVIRICDKLLLPTMHPNINEHSQQIRFTENKTGKLCSNIGLDEGQEQSIKNFKHHSEPFSRSVTLMPHFWTRSCKSWIFFKKHDITKSCRRNMSP